MELKNQTKDVRRSLKRRFSGSTTHLSMPSVIRTYLTNNDSTRFSRVWTNISQSDSLIGPSQVAFHSVFQTRTENIPTDFSIVIIDLKK